MVTSRIVPKVQKLMDWINKAVLLSRWAIDRKDSQTEGLVGQGVVVIKGSLSRRGKIHLRESRRESS